MNAEILLTIKLQEKLFADPRRIELLKRIEETGSISQGAKLAKISYKSAWDAINEMNLLSEHLLVERSTGGRGGGGATLTAYGQRLLQLYSLLEQIQQKAFDTLQDDKMPLDSLLGAIARFSLQTSARNQYFGKVVRIIPDVVQERVEIKLLDDDTVITALVTRRSVDKLQLSEGKEVLIFIKAPWVEIHRKVHKADNLLAGTISEFKQGSHNDEIVLTLEGGEQLCATVSKEIVKQESLKLGMEAFGSFSAESVIIATLL